MCEWPTKRQARVCAYLYRTGPACGYSLRKAGLARDNGAKSILRRMHDAGLVEPVNHDGTVGQPPGRGRACNYVLTGWGRLIAEVWSEHRADQLIEEAA